MKSNDFDEVGGSLKAGHATQRRCSADLRGETIDALNRERA
jgi:hypothetical protein